SGRPRGANGAGRPGAQAGGRSRGARRPSYRNAIPRRVVAASPLDAAKGTPRRIGPDPVITLGSWTPSPLQSKLPLSTTIVPSPTSVFAPVVTSNTAPTLPALP